MLTSFEDRWAVTMFSLTNELLEASRTPDELLADVLESGLTRRVEIDSPQHFRGHPRAIGAEVEATRTVIRDHGARASLLGVYAERWTAGGEADELALTEVLADQVRTAAALGCSGVRIALGTVPEAALRNLRPLLETTGMVLLQEIQGATGPDSPVVAEAVDALERIDDRQLGLLFDISVCTPLVPVSWIDAMADAGVEDGFIERVVEAWGVVSAAEFRQVAMQALDEWPATVENGPLVTACLSRFGVSAVEDWRPILPLVRGVHLKFWDTDDRDGRITDPIRRLGTELEAVGFTGDFCSEWGGHQWMSLPTGWRELTSAHRELAVSALSGSAS